MSTAALGAAGAARLSYRVIRHGRQAGVDAWTHRFRHHFSHTWLDRGGSEGDLMELNGLSSPQMLRRGDLLVVSSARPGSEGLSLEAGPPWPLRREDLDAFSVGGVSATSLEHLQTPMGPAWFARFTRIAKA